MNHDGAQDSVTAGQPRTFRSAGRGRRRGLTLWVVGLVLLVVLLLVGYTVFQYLSLTLGIKRSDILGGDRVGHRGHEHPDHGAGQPPG
jgi:type VI protein secretion system component VasF